MDGTTGGDANTSLSGAGATLEIQGLQASDIAGDSFTIGDISIDVPDNGDVINYNQEVTTDDENNPFVFTRGDGAYPKAFCSLTTRIATASTASIFLRTRL